LTKDSMTDSSYVSSGRFSILVIVLFPLPILGCGELFRDMVGKQLGRLKCRSASLRVLVVACGECP
jgi:hypothetical protein